MSTWKPIETAPRDGREILGSDGRRIAIVWWFGNYFTDDDPITGITPIYWTELPGLPGR